MGLSHHQKQSDKNNWRSYHTNAKFLHLKHKKAPQTSKLKFQSQSYQGVTAPTIPSKHHNMYALNSDDDLTGDSTIKSFA